MRTRRHMLACLPAVLAPAAAEAFRLENPTAEITAEYGQAACPEAETHASLRAELDRLMEGRPLPAPSLPPIASLARCPFCGCAVLGASDHGEGAPGPRG